jgi:alpha-galactosidase
LHHLGNGTVSLVVDVSSGTPVVCHWGLPLDATTATALTAAFGARIRPLVYGAADVEAPISLVPTHAEGSLARPGISGHRQGGRMWAPRFSLHQLEANEHNIVTIARDDIAQLDLHCTISLQASGVVILQATLVNNGTMRYLLHNLTVTLPIDASSTEVLTLGGRWAREAALLRSPFTHGALISENVTGRTSHEHIPALWAVQPTTNEWNGEVWAAHLAWSGNHSVFAEVLSDGRKYLQLGELLHPGEICLEPGERYSTPEVIAVHSAFGLNDASAVFHRSVRARNNHVAFREPRKVSLNTWEAVYFNHDTQQLQALADIAASCGVERFVLDDGWFGSRRNDKAGLGDWVVSTDVYPQGLAPLIAHVRALGIQFGIWVEPEMVNTDSDVFRAHPEWVLGEPGVEPVLSRNQLVLNLANPAAFDHVRQLLHALLTDNDIGYVKWDMNRAHVHGSGDDGAAGSHAQTLATNQLLDWLREQHPLVEFESCASGGGRIDHAILQRTERVWASDTNDALERQNIQRNLSMLVPIEVLGAHIGSPVAHTTGRRHSLSFRGVTAMFGHLGIEWNLLQAKPRELVSLTEIVSLYKRHRALIHGGNFVRYDVCPTGTNSVIAHGVIAQDKSEALLCYAQLQTAPSLTPAPWKIHGLEASRNYVVQLVALPDGVQGSARTLPPWCAAPTTLSGQQLATVGLQPPALHPESAVLIHVVSQ